MLAGIHFQSIGQGEDRAQRVGDDAAGELEGVHESLAAGLVGERGLRAKNVKKI